MRLTVFNVEHGGCALIECDNGRRIMIDCGHNASTGWYPGDFLRKQNIGYLDLLVVTNYDQDHISGYPNLADNVAIGGIVRNTSVTPEKIFALKSEDGIVSSAMARFVRDLSDTFGPVGSWAPVDFSGVVWNVMFNAYPIFNDENNLSLLFNININGTGFLFTGDLEKAGWLRLLNGDGSLREAVQKVHVLMASHHGRESGRCAELFDTYGCAPQIIVVSDDYRQHMSQETSSYYYSKCSGVEGFRGQGHRRVITTRNDGAIYFNWRSSQCYVE